MSSLAPADVLLADGTLAVLRPLGPEDAANLHALHDRVSDDAIRMRFFAPSRQAAHDYVDHLLRREGSLALVAEVRGELVGLGTAEPINETTCEVAFLVADETRGQGVGTLLLEHLAGLTRDRGFTHLEADVLSENRAMLAVFKESGLSVTRASDGSTVVVGLTTEAGADLLARADQREFRAEAASLAPMLRPRSVAVVGARSDETGIGATVLRAIRSGGFQGQVVAVHPRAAEIVGVKAFPTMADVPGPVDLVVLCVPATAADDVLRQAAAAGARAAVVVSSGFSELGGDGVSRQRSLAATARSLGIRMIGPNCLGLLLNAPDVRLNATFQESIPPSGGLAIASQSGGVGIVMLDLAREVGLGVRTFVSLGNKADVSSNDLLAAWYDDPDVTAAALYLESFGNAVKFGRFARTFAERKPLLAVVGGRSSGGKRAGASHTASAASPAVGVSALFAQSGVIECLDAEELARTALLLAEQPLPQGRRLGIVSNAGGMGVLAADAADQLGLEVPELSADLQARIAALVQGTTGTANPIDAGAGASPEAMSGLVDVMLSSGEVDALLLVPVATGVTDGTESLRAMLRARADHPDLPVVMVPLGGLQVPASDGAPVTTYRTTASAVRALSRVVRYAEWLAAPREAGDPTDAELRRTVQRRAADLLLEADKDGWLPPEQAAALLADYGIAAMGETVVGAEAAVEAATRMGYPVAMKVADPEVVHKTDRGLVRIGVSGDMQVAAAVADFAAELGTVPPVLVQPMASGVEVALGVVRDPALGPLVMVAAGGVATDVWDDRVFLVPPLSHADASRAVRSLRIWPLLEGYRGSAPADVASLERLVLAVGRLAADVRELAELDLNPVMVSPDGYAVVDVKMRLSAPVGPDPTAPRQLRPLG
ncbi:bifunctional GNAT family N-acetyltransferase/acetate--CoA ligase family protein [Nocardioides sp.]|uniref:bifunctional acetate--CoA ligase family protein/GNAT family N-acetyltransferase n=1 Tax=Nocardioides sp. TaxID=35761 RepID=UPI001A2727DA|nr:bifunctional GNAT family N-acetyltransferase/acetate--CoA ligase family protein [Nocardioides sp.]MBJ7356102.1 GNAT family N-acetyltransferase [Nocardioides sp.]